MHAWKKKGKTGISASHSFPCLAVFLTTGNGAAKAGIKTTAVLRCGVDYTRLGRALLCKFTTHNCFNRIHQGLSFFVTAFAFSTSRYSAGEEGKVHVLPGPAAPEQKHNLHVDRQGRVLFLIAVKSLYYNSPLPVSHQRAGGGGVCSAADVPVRSSGPRSPSPGRFESRGSLQLPS